MSTAILDQAEVTRETGISNVTVANAAGIFPGVESVGWLAVGPESVEQVSSLLRWANNRKLKVVPQGSGTRQDRGAPPPHCDILLDLSRISGVVEHASGDMTGTVRAGTRFDDLQSELARAGQFLALDSPFHGTIGGLIATGDSGPRRLRYGGVRDMLLGVTFVRADGTIARAGGKVVKNVAGYDLCKLFTGSLGTLAVIVEATFRLYPIPPASATVISRDIAIDEAAKRAAHILTSGMVPTIVDYYAEGEEGVLAVRFETSPRSVQGQSERALGMLGASEMLQDDAEQTLWAIFDSITDTGEDDTLARLITTQSELPRLVQRTHRRASDVGVKLSVRAHLGFGHALLRLNSPNHATTLELLKAARADAEARQSNLVVWRAPGEIRRQLDPWGDPGEGLALMRRVKAQFDPNNTLNPGRFVGGI